MIDLTDVNALMVTLPFLDAETKATQAAMGQDFWRYGVHESQHEIEALIQYLFEQGLIDRKPAEELFAPDLRDVEDLDTLPGIHCPGRTRSTRAGALQPRTPVACRGRRARGLPDSAGDRSGCARAAPHRGTAAAPPRKAKVDASVNSAPHSALMLASLTTRPHFSISFSM